jgi:general control protein GCN4
MSSSNPANLYPNMPLTQNPSDYATASFESLDANFGAGLDQSGDFDWDTSVSAGFTAINTGASSTRTVSPKDIFNNESFGSAPPSTAFTNLTSPDMNNSPYMTDSYETSPLFQDNSGLDAGADNWFPLFPESSDPASTSMERTVSDASLGGRTSSSGNSPLIMDASNRRKSSQNASPFNGHTRQSSVSGVNKPARRRKGPLPPIEVDPGDKTALKRARNTLAARDSRQRKLDHINTLESRISELEAREHEYKETLATYGYNGPLLH